MNNVVLPNRNNNGRTRWCHSLQNSGFPYDPPAIGPFPLQFSMDGHALNGMIMRWNVMSWQDILYPICRNAVPVRLVNSKCHRIARESKWSDMRVITHERNRNPCWGRITDGQSIGPIRSCTVVQRRLIVLPIVISALRCFVNPSLDNVTNIPVIRVWLRLRHLGQPQGAVGELLESGTRTSSGLLSRSLGPTNLDLRSCCLPAWQVKQSGESAGVAMVTAYGVVLCSPYSPSVIHLAHTHARTAHDLSLRTV